MKKILQQYGLLLTSIVILFVLINHYLVYHLIVTEQKDVINNVSDILTISESIYYIAVVLLSFILSRYSYKWLFLPKVIALYIGYCILSYLIEITFNLNNEKYEILDFSTNHLYQLNFIPTFLIIFSLVILFKFTKLKWLKFVYNYLSDIKFPNKFNYFLLSQILLSLILTDAHLPKVFLSTNLLNQVKNTEAIVYGDYHFFLITTLIIYLSIFGTLICYTIIKGIKDFRRNKSSCFLASTASLILAIIFNCVIQGTLGRGVLFLGYSLLPGAMGFQIFIFFLLFFSLYLIINQFWVTTNLIIIIGGIFSYSNYIKFSMRGEPILPSDLIWMLTPKDLLSFVDKSLLSYAIFIIVIVFLILFVLRNYLFIGKIIQSLKIRFIWLSTIVLIFLCIFGIFINKRNGKVISNIPIISILNNFQDITWLGNTNNARYKSLSYVWISQITTDIMQKPEGYTAEKIRAIEKKYYNLAVEMNQERTERIESQTVIYVLSESFSDPSRVEGVNLTQNPIPNIYQIKDQVTSGLMKSDGYGGGTANMEFQALTGLPFYNISQSVSILYTEVFPKMNYVPSISNLYSQSNRIAIHLAGASNYSRNYIYNYLNFKEFISIKTNGVKIHKKGISPSDESTYNIVLDNLNNKEGQFFSVMTMQNHAPWIEENPTELQGTGIGFSNEENSNLTFYTRLLYHTDNATKEFLDKLSKIDKKITVVFYGDHLPGLYPQSAFKDHPENQYLTDYFIWSNYETPKLNYPLVNSSDFSALLLEQTNSKVSPYYALLTEVLHKASVDKKALDSSAQEIADDLKLIEYDMVGGKGYLSKDFFAVPAK